MKNVAILLINPENKILALRTSYTKKKGWTVPGGHMERGETPERSIARELYEETGISLKDYQINSKTYYVYNDTKIFITKINHFPGVKLSSEHTSYLWVTIKQYLNLDLEDYSRSSIMLLLRHNNVIKF